jgi:hypothetical protein
MSVGAQMNSTTIDQLLTNISVGWRNLAQAAVNLATEINGQGNGLATLEALGYSSAANPANPGGVSDAQLALNYISYLGTNAGVFFGTASQGTQFNFNNALSPLWAGQVQ